MYSPSQDKVLNFVWVSDTRLNVSWGGALRPPNEGLALVAFSTSTGACGGERC